MNQLSSSSSNEEYVGNFQSIINIYIKDISQCYKNLDQSQCMITSDENFNKAFCQGFQKIIQSEQSINALTPLIEQSTEIFEQNNLQPFKKMAEIFSSFRNVTVQPFINQFKLLVSLKEEIYRGTKQLNSQSMVFDFRIIHSIIRKKIEELNKINFELKSLINLKEQVLVEAYLVIDVIESLIGIDDMELVSSLFSMSRVKNGLLKLEKIQSELGLTHSQKFYNLFFNHHMIIRSQINTYFMNFFEDQVLSPKKSIFPKPEKSQVLNYDSKHLINKLLLNLISTEKDSFVVLFAADKSCIFKPIDLKPLQPQYDKAREYTLQNIEFIQTYPILFTLHQEQEDPVKFEKLFEIYQLSKTTIIDTYMIKNKNEKFDQITSGVLNDGDQSLQNFYSIVRINQYVYFGVYVKQFGSKQEKEKFILRRDDIINFIRSRQVIGLDVYLENSQTLLSKSENSN